MENLTMILNDVIAYIPNIIKAVILLVIAFIIAKIGEKLSLKIMEKTKLDERLSKKEEVDPDNKGKEKIETISKVVYYFILILFLPSILDALDMRSVSGPITNMMTNFLGFIPNLIGAILILVIGYFVAKLLKDFTKSLLMTINLDNYYNKINPDYQRESRKVNPDNSIEQEGDYITENKETLSNVLANIVFVIVLIPVITMALETLGVETLTEPITLILNKVLEMIPNIFVAVLLIVVGYYIAKFVGNLLTSFLKSTGVEKVYTWMEEKTDSHIPKFSLSDIIGKTVSVLIMLFITVEALSILELQVLNTIGSAIIAYIPLLVSGMIILSLGIFFGFFVEGLLKKYTSSAFTAAIAKYMIIIFAIFMTLEQIKFASSIVNIAFLLILGGLSVAFALSFGLGGREFAKNQLKKFEDKTEEVAEEIAENKKDNDSTTKDEF